MRARIEIYADQWSPELTYVCDFIFVEFFDIKYSKLSENQAFSENNFSLVYAAEWQKCDIHLAPIGNLYELSELHNSAFEIGDWQGLPMFFASNGSLPFDIFAAVFYLLARIEEYQAFQPDKHGRFAISQSVFASSSIVSRPIVDEWLLNLKSLMQSIKPDLIFSQRKFEWVNTFDIDVAFAYKGRSIIRTIAASIRNLVNGDFNRFLERFKVLFGSTKDPFDTYDTIVATSVLADRSVVFFLNSQNSRFDRSLPLGGEMKKLLARIRSIADVGIHPSYFSQADEFLVKSEKEKLESELGNQIIHSRQHYLRIQIPETLNLLSKTGITQEYSLGFATELGFRCGTATSYLFFDSKSRTLLPLRIHPLHIMDATLRDYMQLGKLEALEQVKATIDKIFAVSGTYYSLWHNDSLSPTEFPEWYDVYEEMSTYIASKRKEKIRKEKI